MAFGSSFGVAGTAGVILAAIARSGGASLAVTGGAVLSGAYLGERLSPASSSAALTAALAGVEQHSFQLRMWRTTPLPLALSLAFYGGISLLHPIQRVDQTILTALEEGFDLSWTVVLPAVILLVLPFFKVSAARSILVSCGAAAVLAVWEQGRPLAEVAWSCVAGYVVEQPELTGILSGGGLLSMVNGMCIVLLSCASSGILNGAELLEPVKARLEDRPVCDYGGGVCGLRGPAVQPVYRPGAHRTDDGGELPPQREGRPSAVPGPGEYGHRAGGGGALVHRWQRAPGGHGGLRPGHPLLLLPVRRSGVRLALPPEAVPNGIKFDPF